MMQRLFSWQAVGAVLLGIMLARWTWLLAAPASPAMPPAGWEATGDAGRLFGTASVTDAQAISPVDNIRLIGVFAHRTKGFAVMQIDEKQIGVALGEDVKPGIRLVETNADHVVLEQNGVHRRVSLTGAPAPSGAPSAPFTQPGFSQGTASAAFPPGQDALSRAAAGADGMPPQKRDPSQPVQ